MPGSLTTPGRNRPRGFATVRIAFRPWNAVGARDESFAAQWLAYASPCRRFAADLAVDSARLGAGAVRETFTVEDFHLMLLAGLPAHSQIQIEPNPGLIQQSPAKIQQRKSLDFLRRIEPYQGLTPTPRAFFISCAASRLEGGHGAASALPVRPGFSVVSLVFISSSSGLFERGEGLAPFS